MKRRLAGSGDTARGRAQSTVEWLLVVTVAAGLTVLLTYPLAFKIGRGGRLDSGDGQFSIWNVAWVARTLAVQPSAVYDANIFYPHRDTLAYSEANLGAGALAIPPYWASHGNPYVAHNVVFLLAFVLAAVAGYGLVRHVTGSRPAAAIAAITFAYCPYMFARTAHIQLVMSAGLPLSLLALHRFVERRSLGRALTLPVVLAAQALSCGYYGVFAALLVSAGVIFYGVTRGLWKDRRYCAYAGAAAGLAIGAVMPFFLPHWDLQQDAGFGRTLFDASRWSADWRAYFASSARAHEWMLPILKHWNEVLFPGFTALILGVLGMALAWPSRAAAGASTARPDGTPVARDTGLFYTLVTLIALWASFGPAAGLYTVAFRAIPLFSFLRAPARFGIVVALGLSVLAGMAIRRLISGRSQGSIVAAAIAIVAVAELVEVPLPFVDAPPVAAAYRTLARMPYGPVAEFPFFYRREDFPRHALYMVNSTSHWMPLINGYSDHIPADFRLRVIPLSSFPNPESFNIFQGLRLRYAIFHLDLYSRRAREELLARLDQYWEYLKPITREKDVWLYEIVAWPPAR